VQIARRTPEFWSPIDSMTHSKTTTLSETANATRLSAVRSAHPRFLSSVATVFGGQIASAMIALLIEVLCARLLGPEGRGQIALCMMIIALGTMLGGLGGEIPIIIWAAKAKDEFGAWIPAVMFWGLLGASAAVGIWICVFEVWHPAFLNGVTGPLALIVAAAIPASIFFNYQVAVLTGLERFRLRAGVSVATQVTELAAIAILVFFLGRTSVAAVLGILAGFLIGGLATIPILKTSAAGAWNFRKAREKLLPALNLGVRGQLGDLATFFNYRLDVFVVNFFLGPASVGIYAIGVVVSEALWQVPQAAAVALFPRTARTMESGATEFTCAVSRHVLLISVILAAAIAITAPILIPLLFGSQFVPAIAVIWWILPGTVALSLGKLMSADLAARGKPGYSSIFSIVSLAVTLVLDFILIPRFGIQGAAIASSVAYLVDSILLVAKLRDITGVSWRDLLVPRRSEFAMYQQSWTRCKTWLRPVPASGFGVAD
jgi:O-antigen/teichoic acid export membrane protein